MIEEEYDMTKSCYTRAPKSTPDLRLAESYVAGGFAWAKGMVYVSLCLLIQYGNYDSETVEHYGGLLTALRALPFALLYYDHILMWKLNKLFSFDLQFIDSTSLALDVVVGTVACQIAHLDFACTGLLCSMMCLSWCVCSCLHVYLGGVGDQSHWGVALFILSILTFSKPNPSIEFDVIHKNSFDPNITKISMVRKLEGLIKVQGSILPFFVRGAAYLTLSILDIYFLRSPYQREKDRIGMLRYGSILFCPSVILVLLLSMLFTTLGFKIYNSTMACTGATSSVLNRKETADVEAKASSSQPSSRIHKLNSKACCKPPPPGMQLLLAADKNNNIVQPPPASSQTHINFDELDPNEAFKLAKMHCLENKATS